MKPVSCVAVAVLAVTVHHAATAPQYGGMRNGTLEQPQKHKPDEQAVINADKAGWTLPDDLVWPAHWGPNPSTGNSSLEYLPKGGLKGTPAVRIDGGGHIASYFGQPEQGRPG